MNTQDLVVTKAIAQAIGTELRRRRDACGMSRADFASKLPSGYGDRSVFHLERGDREITVRRVLELSDILEDPPNSLLARAVHTRHEPPRKHAFVGQTPDDLTRHLPKFRTEPPLEPPSTVEEG